MAASELAPFVRRLQSLVCAILRMRTSVRASVRGEGGKQVFFGGGGNLRNAARASTVCSAHHRLVRPLLASARFNANPSPFPLPPPPLPPTKRAQSARRRDAWCRPAKGWANSKSDLSHHPGDIGRGGRNQLGWIFAITHSCSWYTQTVRSIGRPAAAANRANWLAPARQAKTNSNKTNIAAVSVCSMSDCC